MPTVKMTSQIHETIESINQLKIQRDFMLSFSRDPKGYIQDWLKSQSRDLKVSTHAFLDTHTHTLIHMHTDTLTHRHAHTRTRSCTHTYSRFI